MTILGCMTILGYMTVLGYTVSQYSCFNLKLCPTTTTPECPMHAKTVSRGGGIYQLCVLKQLNAVIDCVPSLQLSPPINYLFTLFPQAPQGL